MKKVFAAAVAATMVATMTMSVFAADSSQTISADEQSCNIGVKAKYVSEVSTPDVISADVEWGEMEFTYSVGGKKMWNAQTHTYSDSNASNDPVWSATGNTVKVTNHSNVPVKSTFTYTAGENYSGLTGSFTYDNNKSADANGSIKLSQGVVNNASSADHVTATLALAGPLDSSVTTLAQVGTVTVKIVKTTEAISTNSTTLQADIEAYLLSGKTALNIEFDALPSGVLWTKAYTSIKNALISAVSTLGRTDGFVDLKITGPEGVNLPADAFKNCTALRTFASPDITTSGKSSFLGCTGLVSASFGSLTQIRSSMFSGCTSLQSLTFGSVVTTENLWTNGLAYSNVVLTISSSQLTEGSVSVDLAKNKFDSFTFKEIKTV